MEHIYNDIDFINIIDNILKDARFLYSQSTTHHGLKKLDHSIKVAYYSYLYAKKLNLEYVSVARGGLLHDFFYSNIEHCFSIESCKLIYSHNKAALYNSSKYFKLNDIEKDIIYKHMFPVVFTIPKYKESFLVSAVDKVIGTYEFICKARFLVNFKLLSKVVPSFIILFSTLK